MYLPYSVIGETETRWPQICKFPSKIESRYSIGKSQKLLASKNVNFHFRSECFSTEKTENH